jgi:hypothetical protein
MADSHSIRDLPKITFSFVESYIAGRNKASGDKHLSKGYKYWAENYVKDLCGE